MILGDHVAVMTSPFLSRSQSFFLGNDLGVSEVFQGNGLGRAFGDADAATLARGRVNVGRVDGVLSKTFAKRGTSANNLTGRLVVADATEGRDSWPGIMASGGCRASG